jgi:glycosyltransferase involved in cell wall biosynthesis
VRILYLNHTSQMSGGERSLMLLLSGLPDEVLPILACPPGTLAGAARTADVPWVPVTGTAGSLKLHPLYTAQAVRDLSRAAVEVRRACDELSIDLVHANSIRAGLIAALARRLGGPPTVVHLRDVLPPGAVSAVTMRSLCAGADAIVANSRYTYEHQPVLSGRARTWIVHNPVNLDQFDRVRLDGSTVRRELGLAKQVKLLSVVAQITPWKGQDTAIGALAELRRRGHDAHLALVGSAKFVDKATRFDNEAYLDTLYDLIADLGVSEHVSFLGEREDIPDIMVATDVLLMPSWQEPFGRAIIEAMAVGTPVVATSVGGTNEIVTDGVDGLLVSPTEPDRWAQVLDNLLGDPQTLRVLGAAGCARAHDFALQRHVPAMLEVYSSVMPVAGLVAA